MFVCSAGVASRIRRPAGKSVGWIRLFDGKTTEGWRDASGGPFPGVSWRVEDGCLRAIPNPDGFQDIVTTRLFASFELEFEWKISAAGNSGVKYFVQRHMMRKARGDALPGSAARGFEYQITDDIANPDALSDPKHTAAALYGFAAPGPKQLAPVGEFNRSRIVLRGGHIEHWLNGVKVVEANYMSDPMQAAIRERMKNSDDAKALMSGERVETPIALQHHSDPVWFRSIKIRRLD